MAGILDYKNYLNTLQTATFMGNIFPGDQKTMNFELPGGGVDGWTAELSWMTLIIDSMSWTADQTPNFTDTSIFGYYVGGTASQVSNGVISIPANMYTGPILPTQDYHVPITVVNVRWSKDGETYAQNLAWMQNWEPGVLLGDPIYGDGFIPIVKESSTLTLSGPGAVVWQANLTLIATTDIPIDLGPFATAYFFWDKPAGRVLLGTASFNAAKQAILNYSTAGTSPLVPGTYPIYAEFSGVSQYGFQRSNTVNQVISGLIPLVLEQETFTPNQSTFNIGDTLQYYVKFKPDPSYPSTGNLVNNAVRLYRKDAASPIQSSALLTTTNFTNGAISYVQPITSNLVDTSTYFTYADSVTITTSTITSNVFYYTADVSNTYEFQSIWDADTAGPYASGSYAGRNFTVETTVSRNIPGQAFPMTLTWTASDLGISDNAYWPSLDEVNWYLDYAQRQGYLIVSVGSDQIGQLNWPRVTLGFWIENYQLIAFKPSRFKTSYPGPSWIPISEYNTYRTQFLNNESGTFYGQTATFTINTPRTFGEDITLTATDGSTSTVLGTIPGNIEGGGGPKVINSNVLTTGTWTVVATFPGDLGTSIDPRYCNLASTSNQVTLTVRTGNDLPVTFEFNRTDTNDILTTVTPVLDNLERDVSFYNGLSFINTASWSRVLSTTTFVTSSTYAAVNDVSIYTTQGFAAYPNINTVTAGWVSNEATAYNTQFPYFKSYNKYTLLKYKGTETSTATYLANPLDTINTQTVNATTINSWPGDSRGYNVIALNKVVDNLPRTLGYGSNGRTIQLEEFIGVTTIGSLPYHLYRFSPEIAQTSDKWNVYVPTNIVWPDLLGQYRNYTNLNPITYQNQVWMNTDNGYAFKSMLVNGQWTWVQLTKLNFPSLVDNQWRLLIWPYYATYLAYGKKTWISLNTSDPVENERAAAANELFSVMTGPGFVNAVTVPATTVTTITTVTDELNYQAASVFLAKDTIANPSVLRATWPGTLDLPIEYGRWNPFDINVGLPATSVNLLANFDLVVCGAQGGVDGLGNYLGNAWTKPNKTSSAIYDNNDYYLTALIEIAPTIIGTSTYVTNYTGTVQFINDSTGAVIGSASVVPEVPKGYENYQAVARLAVRASDIVATAGSHKVNIKATFIGSNASTSTSDIVEAQVIKSSYSTVPFTYTNNPQKLDMGYNYGGFEPTDSVIAEIISSPVVIFNKADYVGKSGNVTVSGRLDYIWPAVNYRGKNYVGNANIDDYPGNEGGDQFQTDFYGSNSTLYSQFRVGYFYELETYTGTSTGIITVANSNVNYYDQRIYSSVSPSAIVGRNILSLITKPGGGNLTWSDNWIRIRIYQRVASYFFVGTTPYVSSIGLNAELGFNPNLSV